MATKWQDAPAEEFALMTKVENLKSGDRIQYGLSALTVASVVEYGTAEIELSFAEGGSIILAKTNWFQTL